MSGTIEWELFGQFNEKKNIALKTTNEIDICIEKFTTTLQKAVLISTFPAKPRKITNQQ